jgi:hypothetical protein
MSVAGQSKIVRPTPQSNTNSGKRTHVATLRSSDSPEGSRVAISSDQSLNNYEAYRRGDRFYVKIPAADVPRAEAVRGRGFADVKAQRAGDSTLLSFRLQPGATAHVEQRANKLDVVVSVPGGGTPAVASNRTREVTRPSEAESKRSANSNQRGATPSNSKTPSNSNKPAANSNKNSGNRNSSSPSGLSNLNSNNKSGSTSNAKATPTPAPSPSPKPSATAKLPTPTPAPKATPANAASPAPSSATAPTQARTDAWSRMKERAHYWLLLAQLNPIPVVTGALILLAIIALLLFQRRRARGTRRVKPAKTKQRKIKPAVEAASAASGPASESALAAEAATSGAAVATANPTSALEIAEVAPASVVPVIAPIATTDDGRRERVAQVSSEAKKVFDGHEYDESIVGSDDRETRRLVGAELLSAMVGRNLERRERARAAFMKHGYFDDATRDLRVAESENERAAAARRLSFVQDREATPHLIGALGDPAPDVRRAAVEALMDIRDPAAIPSLNSLMQNENDRKVPRPLIQQAIDACATSAPAEAAPAGAELAPPTIPEPSSQSFETEREVIEL